MSHITINKSCDSFWQEVSPQCMLSKCQDEHHNVKVTIFLKGVCFVHIYYTYEPHNVKTSIIMLRRRFNFFKRRLFYSYNNNIHINIMSRRTNIVIPRQTS